MFKKLILVLTVLAVLFTGILFINRNRVKSFVKGNSAIYSVAKAVAGKLSGINPFAIRLGNLDNNEGMRQAAFVIDFDDMVGKNTRFWQGLGQDSFKYGFLKSHNRAYYELIGKMNQIRPVFRSAHSKGMLCDTWHEATGENTCGSVYRQDDSGTAVYDWTVADQVYDLLLANRLKPLVSFTYMPSRLASEPNRRNPWNKSHISPPKDYREWQSVIYNTVSHLKQRYGHDEIQGWYFEVWNEPDLPWFFWVKHPDKKRYPNKGDNKAYFKLYDYTAEAATKALPNIKIGGPAIAGDIEFFINDWLPHCESGTNYASGRQGTRVDFLSMHAYGNIERKILPKIMRFVDKAEANGGDIAENADFLITEYGPTAQPEPWLNSRYVAAWMVKFVDGIFFLGDEKDEKYVPDLACFWTKPIPANFDKHFGLATAFGHPKHPRPNAIVKRPAFNAFDALSRLGTVRLDVKGTSFGDPIRAIAAKTDEAVQILVYHLDESDPHNSVNRRYPVNIEIRDLPFRRVREELYVIDELHSNAFTVWEAMGSPKRPSAEQLRVLQQKDDLERTSVLERTLQEDEVYRNNFEIQHNSVALLLITQI